ncbi:MAG: LegC family aminotransferase [Bdellovibrionales bacterium]|nr:LegC family aminotransferase [Bdellovibrionales bacterium]
MELPSNLFDALQRIQGFLPETGAVLHEPRFVGNESKYVQDCIATGWVSSVGSYVDRFESDLAAYTGVKRAVVVANGTVALQVALELADVRPGDEVLIPTLSFIATANAVMHAGATPHFVDSEEKSLGIDVPKLSAYLDSVAEKTSVGVINKKTGKRIAAIVPVHIFGHPVDLDALLDLGRKWGLVVLEDAAESLGSLYQGKHTGSFGRLSAVSFNGNKIVTSGGGGAILTQDEALGKRAKHLTTTAKIPHAWEFVHDEVGYNFRLTNLAAALGCAQLEQISTFVEKKRRLADEYRSLLKGISGFKLLQEPSYSKSNYWLNALVLDTSFQKHRDDFIQRAHEMKVGVRPVWKLLHSLKMYRDCPRSDLSVAEKLERSVICLPSSPFLAGGRRT